MAHRILIVKPSSFGDIVHLFPALELMRRNMPDAELDFVVNPEFASLLDYSPFPVRRRIIFERRKLATKNFLPEVLALRRELRKEKYDFAVDFQGLFRSGFLLSLCKARVKAGFSGARERSAEIFYNRRIKVANGHAVERYGELARKLFDLQGELIQPELPENPAAAAELPALPEKYIVLLPGTRWESKRFPPELFGKVCRRIKERLPEYEFIAAGSKGEREIAGAIGNEVINLAGTTTLPGLFELLRHASAVIGNDSGPLHAAAALKRLVYGFYGPTEPDLTGPWGDNCRFFYAKCSCAGCLNRICPDGSYRCWDLDPDSIGDLIINEVTWKDEK